MAYTPFHPGGALTPPETPTSQRGSLDSIMMDSSPLMGMRSRSGSGGRRYVEFPVAQVDYVKEGELGSGRWSTVYRATPIKPLAEVFPMSPPTTPTKSAHESLPKVLAVKVAVDRAAQDVLDSEARIMSYMSQFRNTAAFTVPFFGVDPRNGALVMEALPFSLEDYVQKHLNEFTESERALTLKDALPELAIALVKALVWLHDTGLVHADIKPGNILLQNAIEEPGDMGNTAILKVAGPSTVAPAGDPMDLDRPQSYRPLIADFSTSFVPSNSNPLISTPSSTAGGTWDFMAPELLHSNSTAEPNFASDIYALAITIFYVVIGCSPFAAAKTEHVKRAMIIDKHTNALEFGVAIDGPAEQRISGVKSVFKCGKALRPSLAKDPLLRPSASQWLRELRDQAQ